MMGEATETKQCLIGRRMGGKTTTTTTTGWTEAGHFTAHTSHNRNQELSGGVRSERGRKRGASPRKPRKQNL